MDQVVFKIQDEKIFVTDPFFYTGLNIAKEQIQGKNYKTVLSTYINKEVAKKFSELMKGKRNQIYTTTTVSSKEKDLFFLSIFGYRFETETGVDIFGAVVETGQLDKQL